jgi:uncharacterized membrane protein
MLIALTAIAVLGLIGSTAMAKPKHGGGHRGGGYSGGVYSGGGYGGGGYSGGGYIGGGPDGM